MPILTDKKPRPWQVPDGVATGKFQSAGYHLGAGSTPLEVAIAKASSKPTEGDVRTLWKRRKSNTPSPLLLIVIWPAAAGDRASMCGPVGDSPPVYTDRDPGVAERLALSALAEPDHHAATRFLASYLPEEAGGLRNVALFSTHHLIERIPQRADWSELCQEGERLAPFRREQLVKALGFTVEAKGATSVLRASGTARALAVFLDDHENPDATAGRFNAMTPVSWAITTAAADNIPYVVMTRGPQLRIYTTKADVSPAAKGGTGTFLEINLALLTQDDAGYLPLLFSAKALADNGHFEILLRESFDYAADLGIRLRSRVYDYAVPALAGALIADHRAGGGKTDDVTLEALYEQALLVLFRLLFVAYAEDRDLLPLRSNGLYRHRSLKQIARNLTVEAQQCGSVDGIEFDEHATDLWSDVRALWTAIDKGRKDWNVPAYNGGMFTSDPAVEATGAALARLELTNAAFGPALAGLLVDETADGEFGPVDFASLDVREFGTIYEGLLESNLAVAPVDLTLGKEDEWVPARAKDEVWVEQGGVYLHNKSGARKASGSYFTKPFAVAHLLDNALDPALDHHVARLQGLVDAGDDVGAAEAFFDFRCADLAMGSGHFLVAAVDRIERRLSTFLVAHHIPGVHDELARLEAAAQESLARAGIPSEGTDTNALLRRQITRRCVYGVDLNPTSVELARLALWLHAFVRGLPLTSLNHGLVQGNSLTGIGTLDEAIEVLDPDRGAGTVSFVRMAILEALESARKALRRFADTSEATAAEVMQARSAHAEATAAVAPARLLFDMAVAVRMGDVSLPVDAFDSDALVAAAESAGANDIAGSLRALHFPVAFPEVFLRERPGFDCVLGNPPWDKIRFEPQQFWVLRSPGLNGLSPSQRAAAIARLRQQYPTDAEAELREQAEREQLARLVNVAYEWHGRGQHGHHDLAKLFAERVLKLVAADGHIGIVLPRTCLVLGGWTHLRRAFFSSAATSVLQARNKAGWLFDDVHFSIAVVLVTRTAAGDRGARIWPAVMGREQMPDRRPGDWTVFLPEEDIETLTDKYVIPWFSGREDRALFDALRVRPNLGGGEGWITCHADSSRWDFSGSGPHQRFSRTSDSAGAWKVLMTRHVDQYRIATEDAFQRFIPRPAELASLGLGVREVGGDAELDDSHPLLAFRYPSRSDDSRTVIATALPASGYLYSKGYVHGLRDQQGRPDDLLALLGYLNTFTADWWVRRFNDRHVTAQVIHNLPLPAWNVAERRAVRGLVSALLVKNGVSALPRGIALSERTELTGLEHQELLARIEAYALAGFGLEAEHLEMILADFSDKGCPSDLRAALIGAIK